MDTGKSFSVVMELENATCLHAQEVGQTLRILAAEIADNVDASSTRPAVIFAHAGPPSESATVLAGVLGQVPELGQVARVTSVSVPDGRYYELKNAGVRQADGEVIVLLDADAVPEPGWLATLLAPFEQTDTVAVGGHTYLGHSDLISRTLALVWVFPLRDNDAREADRRPLYSNNCAFRAVWIQANPYPHDNGFKVSCTLLTHRLREASADVVRVPAYVRHAPLKGLRFLVWRALVTGRDADRKFAILKSPSRVKRLANALKYSFKRQCRVVRRVLAHYRHVGMPWWEVPAAVSLGCVFYSLALWGQLARLFGLATDRAEHIPSFVENH